MESRCQKLFLKVRILAYLKHYITTNCTRKRRRINRSCRNFHNACQLLFRFGIVWRWRSASYFQLPASFPYMSIQTRPETYPVFPGSDFLIKCIRPLWIKYPVRPDQKHQIFRIGQIPDTVCIAGQHLYRLYPLP